MHGGHHVAIAKIVARYIRPIANYTDVAPEIDRFYVYDNSVEDADPRLILRAADGVIQKRYVDPPHWAEPIVGRLAGT